MKKAYRSPLADLIVLETESVLALGISGGGNTSDDSPILDPKDNPGGVETDFGQVELPL